MFQILDIDKHEKICQLPKCKNFEICSNPMAEDAELKSAQVCDLSCLLLLRVKSASTKEQVYKEIKAFVKEKNLSEIKASNQVVVQKVEGNIRWDKARLGTGIQITDESGLFLKEQAYMFRSAVAETVSVEYHSPL